MASQNRKLRYGGCLAALCACCLTLAGAGLATGRAEAQESSAAAAEAPEYLIPQQLSSSQIAPADASLLRGKQKEIANEAAFFGYDLTAGKWTWDQVLCPEMPGYLLLHYRSQSRRGSLSLFTALVPRASGRVLVVPVLYRNATPFRAAVESERTIATFNRAVPPEVAAKAIEPDGPWLALGICYAEVAGSEPRVPQRAERDPALVQAPLPTLHLSESDPTREIIFTDRDAPGSYRVWTIQLNPQGRVLSASNRSLADYVGRMPKQQEPKERPMPAGSEPKEKPVAPGTKLPEERPVPQ